MIENFVICNDWNFCLDVLEVSPKLAVAISREHARTRRILHSDSQIYCLDKSDIIFEFASKFLVREDFLYLKQLNQFIQMASESGLIEKWRSNVKIHTSKEEERIHSRLAKVIRGVHIICILTEILLTFILLLERFVYRKVRTSNESRIWKIIEMLIDSDRHFLLETKMI